MTMHAGALLACALASAQAVCIAAGAASAQPTRTIPVRVVTEFGGPNDDPAQEMISVLGVVRTDDGRFVVAAARPFELRVYDRVGRLERRLGREGGGPGEFRGPPLVRHWPGDSVLTYSPGRRIWMLYRLDGTLVREWPFDSSGPRTDDATLYGGAFVRSLFSAAANCRAAVLRQVVRADGPVHEGIVDNAGRTWVRRADGDTWRAYDASAVLLGAAAFPTDFVATQVHGSTFVGYRLDADGFPHITVLEPGLPAVTTPVGTCPPPVPRTDMAAEVRSWMTGAEAYFSDFGRYPRDIGELPQKLPSGLDARIESLGPNNYSLTVWEVATGYRCVVSMGAIRGFPSGVVACGG